VKGCPQPSGLGRLLSADEQVITWSSDSGTVWESKVGILLHADDARVPAELRAPVPMVECSLCHRKSVCMIGEVDQLNRACGVGGCTGSLVACTYVFKHPDRSFYFYDGTADGGRFR